MDGRKGRRKMGSGFFGEFRRDRVVASRIRGTVDDGGLPQLSAWKIAAPVCFCSDWRNETVDPQRETEARLLWSADWLFIRFRCRYREIFDYEEHNERRDRLWLRDVAEVFIRPCGDELRHYKEFEISPHGNFLDLKIAAGTKSILYCDLKSRVVWDPAARVWIAEMGIPMTCLTACFNPLETWHINLFRIEGKEPDRFYSAWRPTMTHQPNFHVPQLFGELHFS
jgi:hypothetical protein